MSVEQEIIETVGFEPRRNYKDRQDYLAALARSVDQAEDEDFDKLPKEAVDWFNAAVRAINKKEELPDFESEDENELDEPAEETEEEPAPVEEAPKARKGRKAVAAEVAAEDEVEAAPARRRKGQAPVKKDHPPVKPPSEDEPIELDDFGIVKGTKNAAAAVMLVKGCRMADITESIGGTYYNLVQRFVKQGHKLEKGANGMLKVTHKDDVGKLKKK